MVNNRAKIAVIVLIVLASLQAISSEETERSGKPCDDVRWWLEKSNFYGILGDHASQVNYSWGSSSYINLGENVAEWRRNWRYIDVILSNETKRLYVNCFSGEVLSYRPTELTLKINRGIFLYATQHPEEKIDIYVGYFTPTEEKIEILRALGMEMDTVENEWKYNLSLELGPSYYRTISGSATNETLYKIAELDFVSFIGDDRIYPNLAGVTLPNIILLANTIDYSFASDFISSWKLQGKIIHTNALDFDQHKKERFIIIFGGPDAPEGVGDIVKQILTKEEQDFIRKPNNRQMFVINDPWRDGQTVFIIAGSNRHQTKLASDENLGVVKADILG